MSMLLERFLRYVSVDTQANESSTTYPSSPGQFRLGQMLCHELLEMGLDDARQTQFGIVHATIPANVENVPVVALNAHVDTSPDFKGDGVNPQVIENYPGGDIALSVGNLIIRVSDCPELNNVVGKTLVTTDGTTLLGGDDKAGVAVIMEVVRMLVEDNTIPHGEVKIVFTCDEEIGKGTVHLEPSDIGADVAYTLDGQGVGEVEGETFSADKATITITGVNIHPSIAKGRMVNAVRLAGVFLDRLPKDSLAPEVTDGRDGFIHPYHIDGTVPKTTIHCLLRDFETPKLAEQAQLLRDIAGQMMIEQPEATITVAVQEQYRNMRDGMAKEPRAVPMAMEAVRRAGLEPRQLSIRGGTDGALLTAKGLPTPNLSCGEHNIHSPLEWVCIEEMETNARTVIELLKLWAGR